jgi:hypothetical protein
LCRTASASSIDYSTQHLTMDGDRETAESARRPSHHGGAAGDGYDPRLMEMQPMRQERDEREDRATLLTPELPRGLAARLYTSHFLSTWNSRLFEFGAVLFLASVFPDTLLPMSVYALVRSASAILFAQSIGSWIDRGNRLTVVRVSIVGQRLAVAASCGILWAMEREAGLRSTRITDGQFALVVLLACVEKLCAVMNLVSVERDWVWARSPFYSFFFISFSFSFFFLKKKI